MREFETGATRDSDETKIDFDGFLSPAFLEKCGEYMTKHRKQADGKLRASDNWQKGIPREVYRKSAWRHFFAWWRKHRAGEDCTEEACALFFNIQGDTHEACKSVATTCEITDRFDDLLARKDTAVLKWMEPTEGDGVCLNSFSVPHCIEQQKREAYLKCKHVYKSDRDALIDFIVTHNATEKTH